MALSLVGVGTPNAVINLTSIVGHLPAAVQDGNLMLWIVGGVGAAPSLSIPPPSGWSTWHATVAQGTTLCQTVFYRFAVGEPSTYTLSGLASARYDSIIIAYDGADNGTPHDVADVPTGAGTTYATFSPITPARNGTWVLGIASVFTALGVTNTTWTTANLTIDAQITSTSGTAANVCTAIGHLLVPNPVVVTPSLVPSGTPTKGLALASAIRASAPPHHSHQLIGAGGTLTAIDVTLL